MKKGVLKKSVLGGLLSLGMLFGAHANATCFVGNHIVERVLSYNGGAYVYLRPAGAITNSVGWYFYTTSDMVVSAATASQTDRTSVNAVGDATACPTTGTIRFMGNSVYLYMIN